MLDGLLLDGSLLDGSLLDGSLLDGSGEMDPLAGFEIVFLLAKFALNFL